MSWSTGKDSALALHRLLQDPTVEVKALLTTVTQAYDRVAMHAVRRSLLRAQADALGLPVEIVELPNPCTNEDYQMLMAAAVDKAVAAGIEAVAFGDLYLEDIRKYREDMMARTPLSPIFPLWQEPTDQLARHMIDGGIKAVITCVDPKKLSPSFAGRQFDAQLLADLPEGADPCGENGEFHSFVYDSPDFRAPIAIEIGQPVERDGFWFVDVAPK